MKSMNNIGEEEVLREKKQEGERKDMLFGDIKGLK